MKTSPETKCRDGYIVVHRLPSDDYTCVTEQTAEMWERHGIGKIVDASEISFGISREVSAIILTLLVAIVTIGGIRSISTVASKVVPVMAVFYISACLYILCRQSDQRKQSLPK